ncbi:MAG: fibronectin type III-like domain-contianing protein [Oscillospiraceae bacterium]|nr:fibronectin type III-like domain-contianing protein [Oscillospiraceae bacterium]
MSAYDSIDAVLWIGLPGARGYSELAGILAGEINPSGRTTDTWVSSLSSDPAVLASSLSYYANMSDQYALSFREGIYVGYRYYESRFGTDEEAYANHVMFPFGHGLSYTEFTEELTALSAEDETVTAEITVVNTGDVPGKDVVELYCSAPYDASRGIEKPSIELAGFGKTDVLDPGEEEVVTITFPMRDLSSWSLANGCYLLEAGDYRFTVGKDVHAALLSADSETFTVEEDVLYQADDLTGASLANRFAFASDGSAVLSRADWDGVSFEDPRKQIASDELKNALQAYRNGETGPVYPTKQPTYENDGNASLSALKDLAYDDEKWDAFLDAFKLNEMIRLTANGAYHTEAISRLGIPDSRFSEGTTGIHPILASFSTVSYPSEAVIGATWNTALAEKYGATIASEAAAYGLNGLYAPSAAVRRSAVSGQAGELFSEDPLLSGKMAASAVSAMQKKQIIAVARNFPFSDAESGFGKNVFSWIDEQTLREIYLRPFEILVKEGNGKGLMASSAGIGVEQCSASSPLLNDLLREEWGFEGIVSTDLLHSSGMNPTLALKNGANLIFNPSLASLDQVLEWEISKDPSIAWALREGVHRICYTLVNNTSLG